MFLSEHSHSRCWVHLVWSTYRRELILHGRTAAQVSRFLLSYARSNGIYMKINYVNPDHVHALIDLPVTRSIQETIRLLKGSSSHFINGSEMLTGRFRWGRGYGAFSVSESKVQEVAKYIAQQAEHHRTKSFAEEYEAFVRIHGLLVSARESGREDQE